MKKLSALFFLFSLSAFTGKAQVLLTTQPGPSPIYSGHVSCIGDVNSDGRNDVIIATTSGNAVNPADNFVLKVYLQTTGGTLAPAVNYPYKETNAIYGVINGIDIADLNNDGRNDLVFCYHDSIGIYFQNAVGGFMPIQRLYSGTQTSALKTGDLNNDGRADIAVCNHGNQQLKVFLQIQSGFTTATYPVNSPGPYDEIEIGDISGDGRDDVALSRGSGNTLALLYVFTQTAGGTLNSYVQYSPPATNTYNLRGIEIVDLNNDGLLDVAATRGGLGSFNLVKWIQDPVTHDLQSPVQAPSLPTCIPIEAADMDCDGRPDIVTAGSSGWGNLLVYSVDSTESYNNYTNFPITQISGLQPQALSLGDFTGDGKIDVVIADFNYGMIVLHNNSAVPASSTSVYITVDTLSTTFNSQQLFFTKHSSLNNGAGYIVNRHDSLRVTTTTRRDSVRIDTMKISIKPICPGVQIDTTYSFSVEVRINISRDTVLLGTRRDSLATSVRNIRRIPGLRVYPNPAQGELHIEAPELPGEVRLLSLTGARLAIPVRRDASGWVMEVSAVAAGMYQLQLTGKDGGIEMVKVMKE